jgi:hypothetical protein
MSHRGVPPPRVLLIYHSSYWAVAARPVDVRCHKVIYKNTRDGDESGAKKPSIINPTLLRYSIYTHSISSSLEIVVPSWPPLTDSDPYASPKTKTK